MEWMYNGKQIQKEDYLLGKKVDKHFDETADNDSILPPQICPTNSTFSQVDMTKKILEDPLVNIKKREIECTQKILQNPRRLKKQQNITQKKQSIEDHQLDMILVSRLKSYEKAGLDLAKILSITKNKNKKKHKSKRKAVKSSSEEHEESDNHEKSTTKQKKYTKSAYFEQEDKRQHDKKHFNYRDDKRIENKNINERHRSDSLSSDVDTLKTNKLVNEFKKDHRYKDNNRKPKRSSVSSDIDDRNQGYTKKINKHHRSSSKEKYRHQNDKLKNNYKNDYHTVEGNNQKYRDKNKNTKYKQQEDKNRKKLYSDNKRYRSVSSDKELVHKKQSYSKIESNSFKNSKSKSNNNRHKSSSSDREHESKVIKDSKIMHEHTKNINDKRSRSRSPQKGKKYQKINEIRNHKIRHKSVSSTGSDEEKSIYVVKQNSKHQHNSEFQFDSKEHMQNEKDAYNTRKDFGLFIPKGHSVKKSLHNPLPVKNEINVNYVRPKSPPAKKKKLTEKEMERMRKEMIDNAKVRDKERSFNVKRYRKEDKKEEETLKPYTKEFLIKQLAHAASQVSVERSIKSNVNKLQKNNITD